MLLFCISTSISTFFDSGESHYLILLYSAQTKTKIIQTKKICEKTFYNFVENVFYSFREDFFIIGKDFFIVARNIFYNCERNFFIVVKKKNLLQLQRKFFL